MHGDMCTVQRKTRRQISQYAGYVRRQFGIQDKYIDVVKMVEDFFPRFIPNYSFRIVNDDDDIDMEGVMAYTEAKDGKITMYVKEEIYDMALLDNGRARFTLAHEGGHVLMHCKENVILQRIEMSNALCSSMENEINPEWQADQFAAELLAPLRLIKGFSVYQIMDLFKVSYSCATNRKRSK